MRSFCRPEHSRPLAASRRRWAWCSRKTPAWYALFPCDGARVGLPANKNGQAVFRGANLIPRGGELYRNPVAPEEGVARGTGDPPVTGALCSSTF